MTPPTDDVALGWQSFQAGRHAEAEEAYARAVHGNPGDADAWCMLGIVRRARGDYDQAAVAYREALRLRPEFPEALINLSNILVLQGRSEEAATSLRALLALRPEYPDGHNSLGVALRNLGRLTEAETCYREALRLRPTFPDAANNLGDVLARREEFGQAVEAYRAALQFRPDYPEAHNNLGVALARLGKPAEALTHYRAALAARPNYPDALHNLGALLTEQGDLDGAVHSFREAVRLRPCYLEALRNLGHILETRGDHDEAIASYEEVLRLAPDDHEAHLGRALVWLRQGDYERGWLEYEWRWRVPGFTPRPFAQPRWDGSSLDGRTILLHAEQGLGDTLQYVRFAADVKKRGGRVLLDCPPPLARLAATCPGVDRVVPAGEPLTGFDVHAPLLSLPGILKVTPATLPGAVPYLFPETERVEHWRRELAGIPEFKVGICWQGNPKFPADRQRSIPLSKFARLAQVPGVRLFSLQKGPGSEQVVAGPGFAVTDLTARLDEGGPFRDTAAVMACLDLVIAPDTALAHLAGALGAPVWVALSTAAHFCWLSDREDSPWYPTARLFRQRRHGDWDEVLVRMAAALRERVGTSADIRIAVSPGELIDRLTILEIKSERLTAPAAVQTVRGELVTLRGTRDATVPQSAELDRLTVDLRAVNEELWEVEDALRLCEKDSDFGPRFVELARSVYRLNDRRAALKREINQLLGSSMREEKEYAAYGGAGP